MARMGKTVRVEGGKQKGSKCFDANAAFVSLPRKSSLCIYLFVHLSASRISQNIMD